MTRGAARRSVFEPSPATMRDPAKWSVIEPSPATSPAKQPVFERYPVVDTVNTFYNDNFHCYGMEDTEIDPDDLCCYDFDDCCYDYNCVMEDTELDPDDLCCYDYDYIMEGIMVEPSFHHGVREDIENAFPDGGLSHSDSYTNGTGLNHENHAESHQNEHKSKQSTKKRVKLVDNASNGCGPNKQGGHE
jgi:hypothetical protein